ncbi:MAG: DUF3486 family protein [Rhodobacteraceae bacterium]|nr:DUF3486 family protein [Paracoccaceae bacterium]
MPSPRKVDLLPADVREELNRRIIGGGFGGYRDLADWLAAAGFRIGRTALQEHGGILKRRIEAVRVATEQAEALLAASPDDAGSVSEAALRIAQQRMFDVLLAGEEGDPKQLASSVTALAKATRAGIAVRADRRRILAEAAGRQERVIRRRGLDGDTAAALRRALSGE